MPRHAVGDLHLAWGTGCCAGVERAVHMLNIDRASGTQRNILQQSPPAIAQKNNSTLSPGITRQPVFMRPLFLGHVVRPLLLRPEPCTWGMRPRSAYFAAIGPANNVAVAEELVLCARLAAGADRDQLVAVALKKNEIQDKREQACHCAKSAQTVARSANAESTPLAAAAGARPTTAPLPPSAPRMAHQQQNDFVALGNLRLVREVAHFTLRSQIHLLYNCNPFSRRT